jgi:hypothetical protein
MQELRGEIGTIGPNEGSELRMDGETFEISRIPQGLKDLSPQLWAEVDLSCRIIAGPEPYDIATDATSLKNVVVHSITPGAGSV